MRLRYLMSYWKSRMPKHRFEVFSSVQPTARMETGGGWTDTRFSEIAEELVAIADEITARDNRRVSAKENKIAEQDVLSKRSTFQMMHPLGSRQRLDDREDNEQAGHDAGGSEDVGLKQIGQVESSTPSTVNPSDVQASSEAVAASFVLTPWQVPGYQAPAGFFTAQGPSNPIRGSSATKRKATVDSDAFTRIDELAAKFERFEEEERRRQKIVDAKIEGLEHELKSVRTLCMDIQATNNTFHDSLNKFHDTLNSINREVSKTFNLQSGEWVARHTQLEVMVKNIQLDLACINPVSSSHSHFLPITSIQSASSHQRPSIPMSSQYGSTPAVRRQQPPVEQQ
ncbi:hypothetical protein BGZ91_007816 [Linnemannia elongata]|nr:hypothetical protein BGZ91_007816 [Linnemannia elongata]